MRRPLPAGIEVHIKVLVDVRHMEGLQHMSNLVLPSRRFKVAAHLVLEDSYENSLQQEDPKEDEEGLLECYKV